MSPAMVWIRFPQCCASSSRRSARRAVAMTWAPAACSTRANRAPSPAEAPVTSATRPFSRHQSLVLAPGSAGSASFIVSPHEPAVPGQCPGTVWASLRAHLVDEVEWRLGGAPEPGEAGVGGYLPDGGLAGLGAEGIAAGLRQRVRHAQLGGGVVVDAPYRAEVAGYFVGRVGLDDQPAAVRLEGLADVPGGGERVAHVVQAVERGGQVVAGAGEIGRGGDLEADPVGDAGVGGALAGDLDRLVVVVRAGEPGVRVFPGEQDGGRPEPAPDVGDFSADLEFGLQAVQRRDPGRDEVGDITGAEELLAAGEDALIVLVPAHPGTGAERL